MKDDVVVPLHGSAWAEPLNSLCEHLLVSARAAANLYSKDLAGYVLIVIDCDGRWNLKWLRDPHGPIGQTMLAGIASGAIMRDMLGDAAAPQ